MLLIKLLKLNVWIIYFTFVPLSLGTVSFSSSPLEIEAGRFY